MTETELYAVAEKSNIDILYTQCQESHSMSIMNSSGDCYIGLDTSFDKQPCSVQKTILAHEIGHCEKGAFYNRYSSIDIIERHEYRADKWAIEKLLPKDEMVEAFSLGYVDLWNLAEYFDVTEELIKKALFIYFDNQNYL